MPPSFDRNAIRVRNDIQLYFRLSLDYVSTKFVQLPINSRELSPCLYESLGVIDCARRVRLSNPSIVSVIRIIRKGCLQIHQHYLLR